MSVSVNAFLQANDAWRTSHTCFETSMMYWVTAGDLTLFGDPDAFRRLRDVLNEALGDES